MIDFREQVDFIKGLRLKEGGNLRTDCPFCGGKNTFTADRSGGKLHWNCYKASCPTKGIIDTEMSSDALKKRLENLEPEKTTRGSSPIPSVLSNVHHHDKAMEYLREVNSLDAVEDSMVTVKYYPAENRVLFFTPDMAGATGRALDKRKPKWKIYGDTEGLFSVGKGPIGVVVEDVASACSVARLPKCTGCSLLGTHATSLSRRQLRVFDKVIIALDKDASRKSLRLQAQLEGRVPTRVMLLEEDLKYVPKEKLESMI